MRGGPFNFFYKNSKCHSTAKMDQEALEWYQAQNNTLRQMLVDLHNSIVMLPPDQHKNVDFIDNVAQKERNEYTSLMEIILSLKECVELLHLPEQQVENI